MNHKIISGLILIQISFILMTVTVKGETTVQFRLAHRFAIIVPITINDDGPYDFLLDTGSNTSMISKELAARHSLRVIDHACLHTIAGSQTVPRGYLDRLGFGDKFVWNLEVLATNVSGARILDSHIDGILGLNFLAQYNYLIDYDTGQITFTESTGEKKRFAGTHVPTKRIDGMITVDARASSNDKTLSLVLDSGSQNVVLFTTSPKTLFIDNAGPKGFWSTVFTNIGNQRLLTGRLRSLVIGKTSLQNVTTMITPIEEQSADNSKSSSIGGSIDGLLPTSLFHRVYFDHRENYVIFDPQLLR